MLQTPGFRQSRRRAAPGELQRRDAKRASAGFAHVGRLRTLGTLGDLVLNLLAFREAAEALRLDCGVVDEYVLAAPVRRDEAESLRIVEPLHGPRRHFDHSLAAKFAASPIIEIP